MRINSLHAAAAILGVLTLFSGGYWIIDQTHDGFRPLEPLPKPVHDPYAPRTVQVEARTEYSTADGAYPQFEYASVSFNKEIQATVQRAIDEHFLLSEENQKAMQETDSTANSDPVEPFPFTVTFDAPVHNERIISTIIYIEQYSGGAHGTSSMHTFTYDVQKKQMMTLQDIFAGHEKNLLLKLSAEARLQLSSTLARLAGNETPDTDFIQEGTEPISENFQLFTLSPSEDAVTIYFGLYQVAPYVYGEQQISVPLPQNDEVPPWLQ